MLESDLTPTEEASAAPLRRTSPSPQTRTRVPMWAAVLCVVVGGIAAQVIGSLAVLAMALFSLEREAFGSVRVFEQAVEGIQHELLDFPKVAAAVATTGAVLVLAPAFTAWASRVPLKDALGFRRVPWWILVLAPIGMLSFGPTSDFCYRVISSVAPGFTFGALDELHGISQDAPLWIAVPVLAVIPGFAEEVMFRGILLRAFRRAWPAVLVSGVWFAAYHVDPHHVVAVLPLGLYLSWLGYYTRSLWPPVVAHMSNNAAAVVASTLTDELAEPSTEVLDAVPLMLVGWLVAGGVIWAIVRSMRSYRASIASE